MKKVICLILMAVILLSLMGCEANPIKNIENNYDTTIFTYKNGDKLYEIEGWKQINYKQTFRVTSRGGGYDKFELFFNMPELDEVTIQAVDKALYEGVEVGDSLWVKYSYYVIVDRYGKELKELKMFTIDTSPGKKPAPIDTN